MKRIFLISLLLALSISLLIGPVYAAYDFENKTGLSNMGTGAGYTPNQKALEPAGVIGQVIAILLGFLGVIFLGLMIYGGFTWMMARGNQAEVDKAKRMIESAIIGLIIVLAAYAITYFVGIALRLTSVTTT
jgi:cbb3-type cytochrome oxidase subunit 3